MRQIVKLEFPGFRGHYNSIAKRNRGAQCPERKNPAKFADRDNRLDHELAMDVIEFFQLDPDQTLQIDDEVLTAHQCRPVESSGKHRWTLQE